MNFMLIPDPWAHTSSYQQVKYEHNLKLLPSTPITRALELGCAEGYFTVPLAAHVDHLIAADISQIALNRAAKSCAEHGIENVSFLRLDMTLDPLPSDCDLIVCGEVLYYISGQKTLNTVVGKLVAALKPGGYLLTSHSIIVDDEPVRTKFDWFLPFGALFISKTLTSTYPLRLVKEIRAPRYRVQLFQCDSPTVLSPPSPPEITDVAQCQLPQRQGSFLDMLSLAFVYNQFQRIVKSNKRQ